MCHGDVSNRTSQWLSGYHNLTVAVLVSTRDLFIQEFFVVPDTIYSECGLMLLLFRCLFDVEPKVTIKPL